MDAVFNFVTTQTARIPDGMRVYAVGDIHGCYGLLNKMLDRIDRDMQKSGEALDSAHLVFLGDYVDRGPDSRGVLNRLLAPLPDRLETHFLMGNHEEAMLKFMGSKNGQHAAWYKSGHWGGRETIESYAEEIDLRYCDNPAQAFGALVPAKHKAFLKALKPSVTIGDYHFVHAGVDPDVPLAEQDPGLCLRIRDRFLDHAQPLEKVIVHGHSVVDRPEVRQNSIAVDTGAYKSGILTTVVLEGSKRRFLQEQSYR